MARLIFCSPKYDLDASSLKKLASRSHGITTFGVQNISAHLNVNQLLLFFIFLPIQYFLEIVGRYHLGAIKNCCISSDKL